MRLGFLALFAGIVVLIAALDAGAGPEIVTWPMLLAGLGVGALASQLGSVTVSSVPDEQSGEVGGLQNTLTNLGASIGTALAGAVLIAALTSSFLTGIKRQPRRPEPRCRRRPRSSWRRHPVRLRRRSRDGARQGGHTADDRRRHRRRERDARIDGLQASLAVLAGIALIALFFTRLIPTRQPGIDDTGTATGPEPHVGDTPTRRDH